MDPESTDQSTDSSNTCTADDSNNTCTAADYRAGEIDNGAPSGDEGSDGDNGESILDRVKQRLGLGNEDELDHWGDLMDPTIPEDSWTQKNDRVYADGSVMHTGPESPYFRTEKTITHPDGSIDYLDNHGYRERIAADGTDTYYWADGTVETRSPDGTRVTRAPDGSIVDDEGGD